MVEIAPGLRPILMELKQMYPESQFVLPRLSQWDKGEQARELRAFLIGIGLPPVRFHDLRASWATLLLNKGVAPAAVMSMGGWRDPKTMFIYLRKAGIDIQGATRCLNFGGPQPDQSGPTPGKQPDGHATTATPHLRLVIS
jgi:integrase